jgi:hypothetical protein
MNTITATRLMERLNAAVTTTDRGITRRGNWIFRSRFSLSSTEVTAFAVASAKKV